MARSRLEPDQLGGIESWFKNSGCANKPGLGPGRPSCQTRVVRPTRKVRLYCRRGWFGRAAAGCPDFPPFPFVKFGPAVQDLDTAAIDTLGPVSRRPAPL